MPKFATLISFISKNNKKTGPCGSVQIGASRQETFASCKCAKCPLLPSITVKLACGAKKHLKGNYIKKQHRKREGKANRISDSFEFLKACYAHVGHVSTVAIQLNKSFSKNPQKYTIQEMFDSLSYKMKFVRIGTIGDPCQANPTDLNEIRKLAKERGKTAFGYTHGWDRDGMEKQSDLLRASCMTSDRVKQALKLGFKASLVIPHEKGEKLKRIMNINGLEGRVCDFYSDEYLQGENNNPQTNCNDCLKCDPVNGPDLIIFPSHK